jgi:hypothetical protein
VRRLTKWLPGLLIAATISARGSDFGFESLQQLIAAQSIESVEGLVAALPDDLRSHYTLVFESRSLQQASFSNPRAILFGSHATLVLAFNGEPAERGYNAVETMEFDGNTQHFLFREIQFGGGSPRISAANPPRCLACHGSPARPIWDTPPSWPGVYGQRYHAGLSAAEARGIAAFLALQPHHPRYRSLLGAKAWGDRSTYVPDSRAVYEESSVEPPNAQLSALLTGLNTRSIIAEMAARPAFQPHRYVLLAAAGQACGRVSDFYPSQLQAELAALRLAFDRNGASADQRQGLSKRLRGTREAAVYRAGAAVEDMNDLRFVTESSLGVSTGHWTLAFERGTYDLSAPNENLTLEGALFEWVARSDPKLQDLRAYRGSEGHDRYCEHLRQESRRLLDDWYANHQLAAGKVAGAPYGEASSQATAIPPLVGLCASCHTGEVAPLIPFTDRADLARQLLQGNYRRGRLLDEILYRLDPLAGAEAMPRGVNLSAPDRQGLEQYFISVAASAGAP